MFQKPYFPYFTLGISTFWLILISFLNEIPPDSGDGIMHFFISQASWENPLLFLDHWGKPLFILLSSPFAQLGFHGIIFFQILIFFSSCLIGFKVLQKLNCSSFITSLFPLMLVLTGDYVTTILSALTEPLFNLFLILSLWLLVNKKWLLFALFLSFTPYLRSEGQLCIVLGILILIINKQFKYIPFIFLGFIIYSSIGLIFLNDFWWYFTKSPYHLSNNIYGKGTWLHYLWSYKNYIGNHGLIIFLLAISVFVFSKIYRTITKEQFFILLYSYSLFFIPLILHSYFYATGQNASYGLTRIATQGMPLFLISNLFVVDQLKLKLNKNFNSKIYASILVTVLCTSLFLSKKWPIDAKKMDLQIVRASHYIKQNNAGNLKVFYHHPLIGFKLDSNPFIKNPHVIHYYGQDIKEHLGTYILEGDLLVWDSHFGDVEAGMPLTKLTNISDLLLLKKFTYLENQNVEGVCIFKYKKKSQ